MNRRNTASWRVRMALGLAFGLSLALGGCETPPPRATAAAATPPLVWPDPPDPPRIAFVRSITGPADLGIERGFFQRLADVLLGHDDLQLVRPMAVAAQGQSLYVADPGRRGVHRFDSAAGRHDLLQGEEGLALPSPVGLAAGSGGEVFVSDSALAAVFVMRPGSAAAERLPLDTALVQPTGLVWDARAQRLAVIDTGAHRVLWFDRQGRLVGSFGRRGTGDGEFNYPAMAWQGADGVLHVCDTLNFRVQRFDAEGRFLGKFGRHGDAAGSLPRQKGVATDTWGHVYILDAVLHALQVFSAEGQLLLSVGGLGQAPGEFWLPTGLFITPDATIYIADSHNRRVQVLRYVGGAT